MVVIVAVMRKLLVLAWTLLRTSQTFAAQARPRPRVRADDADSPRPRVPGLASTQPVGTRQTRR